MHLVVYRYISSIMPEDTKPKIDIQTYFSLAYLLIVIVGMLFDYSYYDKFSINIFEYADILDFLLAPAKNSMLIFFAIGSILVVLIFFRLDKLWMEKWPNSYSKFNLGMSPAWSKRYRPFMIGISLLAYLWLASVYYGDRAYRLFEEKPTTVELTFDSGKVLKGDLIGKNSDYIFLLTEDNSVRALPVASEVQEIILGKMEE